MVYMASCGGSCSSANSASLNWFKISELGLISGTQMNGNWGTGEVMKSLSYTTKIPANLAPGEYLIRVRHVFHRLGNDT
jgi:lytic cellulose monooxygenase (C1-hydroxylating)